MEQNTQEMKYNLLVNMKKFLLLKYKNAKEKNSILPIVTD